MQLYEYSTLQGDLTAVITVNGQTVLSIQASASLASDYKTINGFGINRLLKYLAITEFRRRFR